MAGAFKLIFFLFFLEDRRLSKRLFSSSEISNSRSKALGLIRHILLPNRHTTSQEGRNNVAATSQRCSDVVTTLLRRYVFAGFYDGAFLIANERLRRENDRVTPYDDSPNEGVVDRQLKNSYYHRE